ncbi:MAG: hypothetical protein Q9161_005368 [Pseudevernia consocians]
MTTTSSNAPHPWDIYGLDGKNETVVSSLISYGRNPACTSAFNSYAAANPLITQTAKSAGTITLSNGQTTVVVGYTTLTMPMTPAWKSCTADIFEGQDPPRILSPAAALAPLPTDANTHVQNKAASPTPSIPSLPVKTGAGKSQPVDPGPTPNSPSKPVDPVVPSPGDPGSSNNPSGLSKPIDPIAGNSGDTSNKNSPPNPDGPSTGDLGDPSDPQGSADSGTSPAASPALDPTQTPAGGPPANDLSNPSAAADTDDTKKSPLAVPPAVAFQSSTITQGAAPVTISKTLVVHQSGSISAGGEIQAIPTGWGQDNENARPLIVGGLTFSAIPSAAEADNDSQINKDESANAVQINDPAANDPDSATFVTVGGQTIALDANAISVAGNTLKPGDPGITVEGTPVSLGSLIFVVGSRTEILSPPQAALTAQPSYTTIGGQIMSLGSSAIVIDGTTLNPAGPGITVDGTLVSLGSYIVVVGSHTQSLIPAQSTPTAIPSYMTVGAETIAVAGSSIIVAGHTITPEGPAVIADGTLVSLGSSVLVIGTQTVGFTLSAASAGANPSGGIGAMIMKGLGGMGAGPVAAPTQTPGYNGTRSGNGTMVFMGGVKKDGSRLKGWAAWVWGGLITFVL